MKRAMRGRSHDSGLLVEKNRNDRRRKLQSKLGFWHLNTRERASAGLGRDWPAGGQLLPLLFMM